MFKYLSRVRAALYESGVLSNRTTTTDQGGSNTVIQDNKIKSQLPCPLRLVPCFLEACQRQLSQFNVQNNDERHKNSSGSNNNRQNSTKDSFHTENINYHQPCAIIGAVGWSGVLVLGWTIIQPWYRHRETRKLIVENDLNTDIINRYCGLSKLLLHPAFSQPVNNSILPAALAKNDYPSQSSISSSPATPILPSCSEENEHKVLTPEEAFDEAAEEVRRVHERVVGEAENRLGVACLSHKKNREAIEHFRIATANNNAPAAFNLGQCYELGIGTEQDFSQAAHWYRVASDMGHSMAMYNLGVFYAHGWGGLNADSTKAKELFLTAASLGQPEAQAALNLNMKNVNSKEETKTNGNNSQSFESRIALDFFKMNNISLKFMNSKDSKDYKDSALNFKPDSSLPSSSSPSSTMSSSASSTSSSAATNQHPLAFNQRISTIDEDESSESYAETNSDDEWQETANIASMNGNSTTLYRLAVCYENSRTADPELILQLYRMAADHGHYLAKKRLKVLEEHNALGTLDNYLRSIKKKTKYSSVSECSFRK